MPPVPPRMGRAVFIFSLSSSKGNVTQQVRRSSSKLVQSFTAGSGPRNLQCKRLFLFSTHSRCLRAQNYLWAPGKLKQGLRRHHLPKSMRRSTRSIQLSGLGKALSSNSRQDLFSALFNKILNAFQHALCTANTNTRRGQVMFHDDHASRKAHVSTSCFR